MNPRSFPYLLVLLLPLPVQAAIPNPPHEDIHFVAEHVPEAAQDARYLALPWLSGRMEPGRWQETFQVGYARADADFLTIDGPMVAFNAGRGFSDRWGLSLLGFYDSMKVSG